MSTDRPKLQAYVLTDIHDLFLAWKKERGIFKDSQALNTLFAEYFGVSLQGTNAAQSSASALDKRVKELVDQKHDDILNIVNGIVSEVQEKLQSLTEQVGALSQTVAVVNTSNPVSDLPSEVPTEPERFPLIEAIAAIEATKSDLLDSLPVESLTSASNDTNNTGQVDESDSLNVLPAESLKITPEVNRQVGAGDTILNRVDSPDGLQAELLDSTDVTDSSPQREKGDSASDLPNELIEKTDDNQKTELSNSSSNLLDSEPIATQMEFGFLIQKLSAAQLAKDLDIGARAVTMAASKGNEYFREWSAGFGKGTFDFQVVNPGSQKVQRKFFKVMAASDSDI